MLSKITINNTDLKVSELCYGTNMLGSAFDQDGSNALLDAFVAKGGNFLDTARSYGDWIPDIPAGASERAIGEWLKSQDRDQIVIATKGGFFDMRVGDYRNRVTPSDVASDIAQSLEHLQTDRIDLYFLHMDNPEVSVSELIDAMDEHKQAGRVRHYGASNWSADRIAEANEYAASKGKSGFAVSETFWGLAKPNTEAAVQQGYQHYYEGEYEALHADGLPVLAYGAQSAGYFSKLADGTEIPEQIAARYDHPANKKRFEAAKELAAKHGVPINAIALSYLTSQPHQTIPVFGARTVEQIEDSVAAAGLKLSSDELAQLRAE